MTCISPRRLAFIAIATIALAGTLTTTVQAYPITWLGYQTTQGYQDWGLFNIFNPAVQSCYIDRKAFVDRHNRIHVRYARVCL